MSQLAHEGSEWRKMLAGELYRTYEAELMAAPAA